VPLPLLGVCELHSYVDQRQVLVERGRYPDGNLQKIANAATARLRWLARETVLNEDADENAFTALDKEALKAFESGLYSIALFLNEFIRVARWRRAERAESFEVLAHQLSARAGIRGEVPATLAAFGDGSAARDPRALLYLTSHQSNLGRRTEAQASLDQARSLLAESPRREELTLDLLIRVAQVERSRKHAEQAVQLASAEGSRYRESTARVFAGMIALAQGASEGQEHFEAVADFGDSTSWLYRAEAWLALGALAMASRRTDEAYRYLVASQYVFVVLGLQPMAHPDLVPKTVTRPDSVPVDLLRDPMFGELSAGKCTELRNRAIDGSQIRHSVFSDLAGWRRTTVPTDPIAA